MNPRAHVYRVFGLLALGFVGFLIVQRVLQPESFGQQGHFRADSVDEIAMREPVHQGRDSCAECHVEIHAVHQKDVHWSVQCEDCHGPGLAHMRYYRDNDPAVSPDEATMPKEYTLEHVTNPDTRCIECHSPHEPLFLIEPVSEARVHPTIFECDDCHSERPERSHKEVPDHPTIFVCGDCHPSVVRDFAKHQHAFLRCTACHLFHPENEVAGRLYQNGNSRFCLLCHEQKPFKDDERVPQIEHEAHILEKAPVMRREAGPLLEDPTACLQCHFDYIHDTALMRRLQEQER
ncbi:MAG: hypothetical protein ACYTJ0_18060 [Planctomycetota bacterium]|jgi:hypothetical protein